MPIKTEPLVGLPRNFVGRETVTFSTVIKYKEVSVSFNFFTKKINFFLNTYIFLKVENVQDFRIPNRIKVVKVKVEVVKVKFIRAGQLLLAINQF